MSKFALLSGVSGVGAAGAVAVGMATGMIAMPEWMRGAQDGAVTEVVEPRPQATEPSSSVAVATATPQAETTPAVPERPAISAPVFDLVRAEADGSTQVAGGATPGAQMEILVNGTLAQQTTVGGDGKFFAMLDLQDMSIGNVISLVAVEGEMRTPSEDEVIIAPTAPIVAEEQIAEEVGEDTVTAALDTLETEKEATADNADTTPPAPETAEPLPATEASEATETAALDNKLDEHDNADTTPPAPETSELLPATEASEATETAALDNKLDEHDNADTTPPATETAELLLATEASEATEKAALDSTLGADEAPAGSPTASQNDAAPASPETDAPAGLAAVDADGTAPKVASQASQAPLGGAQPAGPIAAAAPTSTGIDPETRTTAALPEADTEGPSALAAPDAAEAAAFARTTDRDQTAERTAKQDIPTPPAPGNAPAILLATPRGVEVLQNAPLAPNESALDAISYDAAGDVLLSGRGDQAAFVRVYLDNRAVTTSRIPDGGRWRVELPEVDAGTYTLRVDQVDEAGQVTARVESPFLRESPAALEAATRGDGPITSVTVQPGNTLWAISKERYGDGVEYVKVFRANRDRIRNPDLIYPGQIFDLPD